MLSTLVVLRSILYNHSGYLISSQATLPQCFYMWEIVFLVLKSKWLVETIIKPIQEIGSDFRFMLYHFVKNFNS